MKIGIDVDNVVVKLHEGFSDFYYLKSGKEIDREGFKGYYLSSFLPISKDEENSLWDEYHASSLFDEMEFVDNAFESINILKNNHELVFISARHPEWRKKTEDFFRKHFPEDNFNLILSGDVYGTGESKDVICHKIGVRLIVEDHPKNIVDYAKSGIRVILLDKIWNKNSEVHENILRASDWKDVLEKINEFEKMNLEVGGVKDG